MNDDDDFDIAEYIEWLEDLKATGKIAHYEAVFRENGMVDFYIRPTKPVEYISIDFKISSNNGLNNDN